MPRAKKAQGHQHNSRHENGIVAPGKRVTKQKSNGHLNGNAETLASVTAPPHPPAAAGKSTTASEPRLNGAPTGLKEPSDHKIGLANGSPTEKIEDSDELCELVFQGGIPQELRLCKVGSHTAKSPAIPRDSIINLALTILRACPLGDTIAILLVLLWLPPTLLTLTNALFAVITFMPSTVALPSFPPTFNDLFVGSGNTPSLATIFLTDIIGFVLWLVIWTPLQAIAVELAQAVVATTLGGRSPGKKSRSDSTVLCMSIVAINHVARHDWLPQQLFGFDWPSILSRIPYVSQSPPFTSDFNDNKNIAMRSPASWIRVLVSLHILIQGLVHVARRWYQKRESTQDIPDSLRLDPEAITGLRNRANSMPAADAGSQPPTPTSQDGSVRFFLPKDVRDKIFSAKRKRRQGALLRSQQPLWAAFATTKLTVLREIELSQSLKEVATSGATEPKNLGSAHFATEGSHVWVSDVQSDSFCLQTNMAAGKDISTLDDDARHLPKPFRVRLNDMDWISTTIEKYIDEGGIDLWSCKVFGLSPDSSYRCSLIRSEDERVVDPITITTPPSHLNIKESSASSESSRQAYQPSPPTSPVTTLQKSIAVAEANLSESQARQKRVKKDIKLAAANIKKDLDAFNSKINKLAGEDKAHTNRNMQWSQLTRQADEALAAISYEIESLGSIPNIDLTQCKAKEAMWEDVRKAQISAREELRRTKDEAQKERSSIQNEATSSQQKRERLVARKAKLQDQHERLEAATAQGNDGSRQKDPEAAAKDLERLQMEQSYAEQLHTLMRAVQETRFSTQRIWTQQQTIETAFHQHQMVENVALPDIKRPLTPEGDLPGTNPQNANSNGFRVPTFGSPDNPNIDLRSHGDTRPRSTSGLSGGSFYADFDDQDPAPPMPTRAVEVIKERGQIHSRNSGHGSGSSGSQRDPASPVGGQGVQISPIGKKSPVWNS